MSPPHNFFFIFEFKMVRFGEFWVLFLQFGCLFYTQNNLTDGIQGAGGRLVRLYIAGSALAIYLSMHVCSKFFAAVNGCTRRQPAAACIAYTASGRKICSSACAGVTNMSSHDNLSPLWRYNYSPNRQKTKDLFFSPCIDIAVMSLNFLSTVAKYTPPSCRASYTHLVTHLVWPR